MRSHRLIGVLILAAGSAEAAPALRRQADVRGDFVLFGNTLGYECSTDYTPVVPSPIVGTPDCSGFTAGVVNESSPDIFWRADDPAAGQASASASVTLDQARSTAVLELPDGARVTYARLYWAGYVEGESPDPEVRVERPGTALDQAVTADDSMVSVDAQDTARAFYQSTADITTLVTTAGPGAFRVSGVDTLDLSQAANNVNHVLAAWSVVVFYEVEGADPRNLALFDGLDPVRNGAGQSATISGFLVPNAGYDAKLGIITYEGEAEHDGDSLAFNGDQLSDALNPATNFFNGSRTYLGSPVSVAGDLPQLTGGPRSMAGVDLDVLDVTAHVAPGETSATIEATSTNEVYLLGGFVTSISTFRPDFSSSGKTLADLNGGAIVPGDELAYTVTAINSGNDPSVDTVMTDALPAGVTFVPGSLEIVSGPNAGAVTDAADDDTGEYDAASRTLTLRLGTGANAAGGGTVEIGESIVVTFRVTVDATASGTISNQAVITAAGEQGAETEDYPTDGNAGEPGTPPTTGVVSGCSSDLDCAAPTPYCDPTATARTCVECVTGEHCTPEAPDCNPTTHVCECYGGSDCTDTDNDGMSDEAEIPLGTDPNDADTDDDGLRDGSELDPGTDTDSDGLVNALDPDSDDDGLFDGTERGLGCGDAATDPAAGACRADGDAGDTTTNPLLADTDDGGASDGSEDTDLDGVVDLDETDPTDGNGADDAEVTDGDDDGLSDGLEGFLGSDPADADSDDDGTPDGLEPNPSHDGDRDGLVDVIDADSDDDGLFDGTEMGRGCEGTGTDASAGHCRPDADPDSVTSAVNPDTDAGGVRDGSEDFDLDGALDEGETDPTAGHGADDEEVADGDGDGLSDGVEATIGTDPTDADSDDDGVIDGREPNPSDDVDGDGDIDALDPDSDGDGLFDGTELGLGCADAATDASRDQCIADADEGATTTRPLDPDTDDGGVRDGTEDANHDGAVDDGETDPNDGADDQLGEDCTTDADCGGPQSGAICDGGVCGPGCRGAEGNGCPEGETCTSSDATAGICVTSGAGGAAGSGAGGAAGSGNTAGAAGAGDTGGTTGDAGAGAGGTPAREAVLEGGGCDCSVPARSTNRFGALGLAVLGLLALRRRR